MLLSNYSQINLGDSTIKFSPCIESNESETRGEPVVGVALEKDWEDAALLIAVLLSKRTVFSWAKALLDTIKSFSVQLLSSLT